MREKDVLREEDANTPTKRLYFLVQAMLMQAPPSDALLALYATAREDLLGVFTKQDNIVLLDDVERLVQAGDYYKALARLHPLIAYEAALLNVEAHTWRRRASSDRLGILDAPKRQTEPV
jgi:flagellar protein FlbT